MKKVLIFDYGFSGWKLGSLIEKEFPVEVKRLIIGGEEVLHHQTNWEIRENAKVALEPFVGNVDVIILANPLVAMIAEDYLKLEFPEQKFIGYGWNLPDLVRDTKQVLVIAPERLGRTEQYQKMKAECQGVNIKETDSQRWLDLVKSDINLEDTDLIEDIKGLTGGKMVLYNARLVLMENRLKEKVKWKVEVVDFFGIIIEILGREFAHDFRKAS